MIRSFYQQNKSRIKTTFSWSSFIFTTLALIVFLFIWMSQQKFDWTLVLLVIFCTALVLPVSIVFLSFLSWRSHIRLITRNFCAFPFSELHTIGFKTLNSSGNESSRFLTDCFTGFIEPFDVICDIDPEDTEFVRFKFFVGRSTISKDEFRFRQNELIKLNGRIDFEFVSKKISYRHLFPDVKELEKELDDFARLLVKLKFCPQRLS